MTWQFFISLRYLTAKHKERFISLINLLSILGVVLGVSALIVVIAVMSGFDEELKEKIIGTHSHIEISSDYGVRPSEELAKKVFGAGHVAAASYFLNGQVLIRRDENVWGVVMKGVDLPGEINVNRLGDYMIKGDLDLGGDGIILGSELASRLKADIGDSLVLVSPAEVEGKAFKVTGVFSSGMYEYDMNLVYVSIENAQALLDTNGAVSGLAVRIDDAMNVKKVKMDLQEALEGKYAVRTWMDQNKSLLAALKLEKTVMFLILTLIVMVACFNISSALIMTVLEKTRDIGILKAIGSSKADIMRIFAMQGFLIGLSGTVIGTAIGVGLSWCLKTYKFITLPRDIYYIDRLPVKLDIADIAVIVISALVISLLSTIYPSYKASKLDPVEALRYE